MEFSIDALCLAEKSRIVIESYGLFVDAVCRCIQNLKITLLRTPLEGPDLFEGLKHYHFLPDGLGHMLSVIYPAELSDDELFPLRERLHKELALSMNFPVFRRGNSLFFKRSKSFTPLLNVHVGLKPSGVKDGKQFLVKGHYWYYHYMQENVDDSGWGCAYRAFQTIFSWFRLQGYTSLRVPNHLDIQKCLVRLNDKESSFIGSRQWIGSTEISYCLDSMIGITSRILSVSSDHELDSVARELQCHFEVHGTPVMIGGGVLAHTILGVDFNESSGEVKFLVLDPHYTGEENIKLIQSKGWVSWKTKTFWAKHTFYNVCLPQRPTCI
ncbi:hypothetical protein AAG570_008212 [Ranatra chinensis]|uniref:Probable Ufm1-specific protease 2 n=1 Tax=Ranatra chinensis TaxID=642074 RepID=A0ABD0YGF0_9HEMI